MITKIIQQLKTGKIKNVVPYGSKNLPAPPYIVVKPERDLLDRGRAFKINVHMSPGQQIFLEDYLWNDLSVLLDNFGTTTRHGNYNKIYTENDYDDIIVQNDDKSISMGRIFLMPSKIF